MTESATDNARLMTEHMNELNECFIQKKKTKSLLHFLSWAGRVTKLQLT